MGIDLITTDPGVMMGKPVIAGTRITVELILEKLAAGETIEQMLDAHPRLTRQAMEDIEDLPVVAARREEPTVEHEELLSTLRTI
ncbi:MAG: DUF433 domain-containing protein [Chloracidobacterium sp.]|nr:DUF433 domain-containing protein [Chloracidobacterium sp.]